MARIKIKLGDNEVEIDSRDFYVDNHTVGQIIADVSKHLADGSANLVYTNDIEPLKSLDNAEVHEPEFSGPVQIAGNEIKSKLETLAKDAFFDKPRTVSETIAQLREYGWIAGPLDVSKTLTRMVLFRELAKDSHDRNYYSIKERLLVS